MLPVYLASMRFTIVQDETPGDRVLLGACLLLLGLSCLMVYSTTAVVAEQELGNSLAYLKKHIFHVLLGLGSFAFISRLPSDLFRGVSIPLFLLACILLVGVLAFGQEAGGARRWLSLGFVRFQPGELAKVAAVLYFSSYIARHRERMVYFLPGAVIPFSVVCVVSALLLLEPDFGSAAIIAIVVFLQLFTVSKPGHLFGIGILAAICAALLLIFEPYRMRRLKTFLDPFEDASNAGYQLVQSMIAVGSGGAFGAGLGAGEQKLFYLPAAHTDFIFAVIAEELGFIGCLVVLALFAVIALRGLRIAKQLESDPYKYALAVGCTLLIVVPCLLNISVVTGLLPTKGLVLPLIAYGGTAMMANLSIVGVLYRLSKERL